MPLLIVTGKVMGNHQCQGFKAESPWNVVESFFFSNIHAMSNETVFLGFKAT